MLRYSDSPYRAVRRRTREVMVGQVGIGGDHPIRVQSMLTSDTRDAEACIKESLGLVEAGCEIVRVTAQTRKIAENLQPIAEGLRAAGCEVPLVADIHFKPDAAMEAAKWVQKVRVNPGNYADKKKFQVREYSDAEYEEELERIEEQFTPLVERCLENGVAMRIGTNHGSLSDRIMNRYGDTPLGMVESALEFARIARRLGYHAFIFSMKASNPKVMIEAYRLLVARLREEGEDWNYPIHLGVTEAGDGEDGRIKSAIGIGSLLLDGIGDTIRVSLTEDAVEEIPVARALLRVCERIREGGLALKGDVTSQEGWEAFSAFDPFAFAKRNSEKVSLKASEVLGGGEPFRVGLPTAAYDTIAGREVDKAFLAEFSLGGEGIRAIDPRDEEALEGLAKEPQPVAVTLADGLDLPVVAGYRLLAQRVEARHPVILRDGLSVPVSTSNQEEASLLAMLEAAAVTGSLICDGVGDGLAIQSEPDPSAALRLGYNILQASGARIFKTDYVACPSCGRTLFNLQSTTQKIREATGHLKGVRIAVMGCIVNGPGEMADADFGYVGGAPSKINLYVGKEAVEFNIPEDEAVDRLIELIRKHDRWVDVEEAAAEAV